MWNKPIHVLGAGSIGLLWTASIRSKIPNYPIQLLLRDHPRNQSRVNSQGSLELKWNTTNQPQESISLPVQFINDQQHERQTIETLIVATKAHQAKQAVESVLNRLSLNNTPTNDKPTTQIIVLCNGALSVREELSKLLGSKLQLALATTTHGAYLESPEHLIHAGVGNTVLEQNSHMTELWNVAGLNCTSITSHDMESVLWNKLAANCVINPLTSLFGCRNGELLLEPAFFELQHDILKEVHAVATASANTTAIPSMDEMRQFVGNTIKATVNNRSSMYQDILANRTTEIDHLNGYVVRKARELQQECQANEDLCLRIAALQRENAKNR